MKRRTKLFVLVLTVLCSASFAWASGSGEVKFGALVPLTGPLAEFGEGFRKAGDLAVQQFQDAGFPIVIKYADTETAEIAGTEAARVLVNIEQVSALIGAAASGTTVAVAQSVSIPNQIPQISNSSTAPLISILPADEGQDFIFRTAPSDALQGVVLGQLAIDTGYKRAAILYVNNQYGQGLMEQFKTSFEFRGGTVVAAVPHDNRPAPTYVSELRQAMDDNPDVMLALGYPGQATVYLKEFFEAGYAEDTDILFCDGTRSVDMPEALGSQNLAGYLGTVAGTVTGNSLTNFEADYEAVFGELPPLPYMTSFYDAVVVAGLAAAAAQARGLPLTGVNIRDMLREVSNPPGEVVNAGVAGLTKAIELLNAGRSINYEGAAGAVDFNEYGDVVTPIDVWEYTSSSPYIRTVRTVSEIPAK